MENEKLRRDNEIIEQFLKERQNLNVTFVRWPPQHHSNTNLRIGEKPFRAVIKVQKQFKSFY